MATRDIAEIMRETHREIPVWILEEDDPVKKPMFWLPEDAVKYDPIAHYRTLKHFVEKGIEWSPTQLYEQFRFGSEKVTDLFRPLANSSSFPLDEKIQEIEEGKFAFATGEAYDKKKSLSSSVGYYNINEGIVVSLDRSSIRSVLGTVIHEFGHALDHMIDGNAFDKRDDVSREIMAILVQESLGFSRTYHTKSPHYKACQILYDLEKKMMKKWEFSSKWRWLSSNAFEHEKMMEKIGDYP